MLIIILRIEKQMRRPRVKEERSIVEEDYKEFEEYFAKDPILKIVNKGRKRILSKKRKKKFRKSF